MALTCEQELELDDEGTRISLTIVDTPGFGDQIDNEARHVDPRTYQEKTYHEPATGLTYILVSVRLSGTSSANTTTFWQKNHESSVTPASGITVCTSFCISSHQPAMVFVNWILN